LAEDVWLVAQPLVKGAYPQTAHFADTAAASGKRSPQMSKTLWITTTFMPQNHVSRRAASRFGQL